MDAGVASQSKTTTETRSSQGRLSEVFVEHNVVSDSYAITLLLEITYNQVKAGWYKDKEEAYTTKEQLSGFQARLLIHGEIIKRLQVVVSQLACELRSGGNSSTAGNTYVFFF